jgi:hypothetical protein
VTLQTTEIADGKLFIQQLLEAKPDRLVPRHTHPGIESSAVGQPRPVRAGASPIASSRLATAF